MPSVSRRALLGHASAVGMLGLLPGCGSGGGGADGGTLVIGQDPEPIALSSAGGIDPGAAAISVKIFDRLFEGGLDGRPIPMLAQSGTVSEDGLSLDIRLRPGALWHDGKPITSADVAFSIEQVWRRFNPRSQLAFANLVAVETPAQDRAILRFSQPAPYIFSALTDGTAQIVPRHLYEGKDVRTNPVNLAPVGSGPWMFENWERGEYLTLRRNPHYWNKAQPVLDRLVFRFIASGAPMVTALETGAIDYAGSGLPLSEIARLKRNPALWTREQGPNHAPTFTGFAFNLNRPVLRDVRVRQAFAHAIDKDFILRNIWLGNGVLADSPIPPDSPWHAPGLPVYAHDPAKAEALLDAAGLPRGADGVRLRLTHDVKPPGNLNPRAAQFISQSLSRIGVELTLRNEGLPAYLRRIFTTRDWDTETYGTGSDIDPAIGIQRFYSTGSIQVGVPFSNPTHYSSPVVDDLFRRALVETDQARRRQLYCDVQAQVQRDLPLIPILFPTSHDAGSIRFDVPDVTRSQNFAQARPRKV
jgi:peptide/nickel transport system substrate-binding protein